jgi:hypothetical protein
MSKRKRNIFSFEYDDGMMAIIDELRERERHPPSSRGAMVILLIRRAYCALECGKALNTEMSALDVWRGEGEIEGE